MIELDANADDDPAFLAVAGRLIAGGAAAHGSDQVTTVHIDHWFGERWLGFRGKILGAAGVRSRGLRGYLGVPPFHPNRVQSARVYQFATDPQRFEFSHDGRLHGYRTSESNVDRQLMRLGLYAWYSGDTAETGKGVVMVYVVGPRGRGGRYRLGWYATFENAAEWRLTKSIGIAPRQIAELIELAPQPAM